MGHACIALGIVVVAFGFTTTEFLDFMLMAVCGLLLTAIGFRELVDIDRYED